MLSRRISSDSERDEDPPTEEPPTEEPPTEYSPTEYSPTEDPPVPTANTSGNMADGMTLKLTPLTRDGSYKLWAGQVKSMSIVANRLDKLLTSEPGEDADAKEKDTVCKARLMLYVSGPLRDVGERAGTAKEAWEALRQEYLGDLHARKPKLMDELTRLSQERGSIVDYIDSAKELRDKFEDLDMSSSLPLLCHKFIQGLDSHVLQTCGPILSNMLRGKDVGLDELCVSLREMSSFIPGGISEVHAAQAEIPDKRRCYYCRQTGHLKKDCRKRENDRKSGRDKRQSGQKGQPKVLSTCANVSAVKGMSNKLVYDTGATHHVVNNQLLLHDPKPSVMKTVKMGGGEVHRVTCQGTVVLKGGP
jgi:hypothetical protein